MENPAVRSPFSARPEIPPAIGYSLGGLLLWQLRRPIAIIAFGIVRLALALVKPALLVLGIVKVVQLTRPSQSPEPSAAGTIYAGDSESLLTPARDVGPAPVLMTGL